MRRWGLASALCLSWLGATAAAQPASSTASDDAAAGDSVLPALPIVGYAALPGGMNVPSAMTLPRGAVDVAGIASYGYRKGLLAPDERFFRLGGDLAVAYAPTSYLDVALSLDGRYDRHYGLPPSGDDGYVGDPHLFARLANKFGNVHLGVQVGLWVPGKDAPSIAPSAISVDLRALASIQAGPGVFTVEAGYRIDNSAKSIAAADVVKLSPQDQVSLGVSSWSAVLAGLSYSLPIARGKGYVTVEGSLDKFVGSGAPSSPIYRYGVTGGLRLSEQWTGLVFIEGARVPGILLSQVSANEIPLLPYEPYVTGGIGLQALFGGPKRAAGTITENGAGDQHIVVQHFAALSGTVTDDTGAPMIGAAVKVTVADKIGTTATDEKGAYKLEKLPIANAQIDVTVDGKKPGTATLALVEGDNLVPKIALDPVLPPGQLRGVVRSLASGKALAGATITVTPGDGKVSAGADGTFQIDLAPGQYKITVAAPGLQTQQLDVTIDPNGVAIKNIDMHK